MPATVNSCDKQYQVCLEYNTELNCLVLTDNLGNDKPVKLPAPEVTAILQPDCKLTILVNNAETAEVDLTPILDKVMESAASLSFNPTTCVLSWTNPGGELQSYDLSQILDKIAVSYDPATHSLVVNNNGTVTTTEINCATLTLVAENGQCLLRYTNEKGQVNDTPLPTSSLVVDEDTCTATFTDIKGEAVSFITGIDPTQDICIQLNADNNIVLVYKDHECELSLPDFVTSLSFDTIDCQLKAFMWSGNVMPIDIFSVLGLNKNDDGGFDIRIKDQLCTFAPATLVQDPDNPNQYIFNNQFGGTATITVPTVELDMDGASLNGSVLTLTFGGDGNSGSLSVDICQVVAQNCNATLTVNADGSLTHVSNSGTITTVTRTVVTESADGTTGTVTDPAGNSCTFLKQETITVITPNAAGFEYVNEGGQITQVNFPTPADPQDPSVLLPEAGTNNFTHQDGEGNNVQIFTGSVIDQGDGSVELTDKASNTCLASTEYQRLLCDDDDIGIMNFQTLDMKTGVITPRRFGISNKCVRTRGGTQTEFAWDEVRTLKGTEGSIYLPCDAVVEFTGQYDLIVDNPDGNDGGPNPVSADMYSGLCIDGATGFGTPDRWFTQSDAPIAATSLDGRLRDGEYSYTGSVCVALTAGLHTFAIEVYKWRANTVTNSQYRITQSSVTASWAELVCKA